MDDNIPTFHSEPLRHAARLIAKGDIDLLSLDIFETLLFRAVPAPIDVFLRIGTILKERDLLGPGQSADSFAAIRYQTEYEARNQRQRQHGEREITLSEIYAIFPPHTVKLDIQSLCLLEIETETHLTFAHDETLDLARWAKDRGCKLALISNMYLGGEAIRAILARAAPTLPPPDGFYISSDHRCGKRTGLMRRMLEDLRVPANRTLHIGDNPISDKLAATEQGLHFVDFGDTDGFYASLTAEHPRQWHERAVSYGQRWGDAGLTGLRRTCAGRDPYHLYGQRQMGPLLTGFAAWLKARATQNKAPVLFGLLREGAFLAQLVQTLSPPFEMRTLAASRLAVALAGFTPDHPHHLEDFLTRRGFWTLAMLLHQLGFTEEDAAQIDDPNVTLETIPAPELTQRLIASPLAARLYEKSAARRARLMRYLHAVGALDQDRLYLCDLGYAATIQRGIQRVLTIEKIPTVTHGLYLAAAHVSRLTQSAGGIVEGFLAQNGNPNDFACAFCRCPEIVELACMPAYGTVMDYDELGQPIMAADATPKLQSDQIQTMQQGMLAFAHRFAALQNKLNHNPDFSHHSWAGQMRALALRLVAYPTLEEAELMGHWQADSDMGLASPRPIVSAGPHETALHTLSPTDLAALPRRDVPWLYGVAAKRGPEYAAAVARKIMRRI